MANASIESVRGRPRILLFSQRHIHSALFRCPMYEFEDIVSEIDSVEVLAPRPDKRFSLKYKIAKRVAWHSPITLNTDIREIEIKEDYELFLAICGSAVDLLFVDAIKDWPKLSRTSVCVLDDLWVKEMPTYKYLLRILAKFDFVMLYYSQSVEALSERIGSKCSFLPPGVDAIEFCPYPNPPKRVIDVYSIGRRSNVTHQKLLRMAKERRVFYVYDSIAGNLAINSKEHRLLFADMAKRSRYFIVNPGLIDRPDIRGNQIEIGNRYFEGAASGTIMIGEHPRNEEFGKLFNWPDAVLHLPYDSEDIDTLMNELDTQPDR